MLIKTIPLPLNVTKITTSIIPINITTNMNNLLWEKSIKTWRNLPLKKNSFLHKTISPKPQDTTIIRTAATTVRISITNTSIVRQSISPIRPIRISLNTQIICKKPFMKINTINQNRSNHSNYLNKAKSIITVFRSLID